ncbi:MAG: hypothetical protein ACREIF_04350 [Chthoniobacterales bacterium]
MRIIEVRPSKKFKGAWVAFESPGVEPAFAQPNGREKAIAYARGRFGGSEGEIHVYDEAGQEVVETITIDDRIKYPSASA